MELSDYAKQVGLTYKTAWQWWKCGQLDPSQLPTGTVIVREPQPAATGVEIYARASSAEQKEDATRQHSAAAYSRQRGYQVVAEESEIASSLNDERSKRKKLLTDAQVGTIAVAHRDQLTRFGYGYVATHLEHQGRRVETLYLSDTGDGLVDDLAAVITSIAARI